MKRPSFAWASPAITATGKRFGFDAHYFAKNTAVVTLSHGVSTLKGLVTGYLVTLLFPPEMYGEYRFVLGVIGTVSFIGLPGLPSALASAVARKEPVSVERLTRWFSLFALIGSLMILGCIVFLPQWGRAELWPLFLIAALVFTPSTVATSMFGGIIRGRGQFVTAFYANLISNILVVISVLAMLLIRPSSLLLLTFTSAIPALVYVLFLIPLEREMRTKKSQKDILKTAANLSIATIPSNISWYIDGLLLTAFFGLNQLALFSVAMLIPEQIKVWTKELFPILFSKQASGKDTPDRRRKMHQAVMIGTVIFAVGILCYVLAAPFVIPVLFPRYIHQADELVMLTSIAAITLIVAPASVYPQFLEARRMVRQVHISNWISSAVFLVALFSLIPLYGPLGAILARGLFRLSNVVTALTIVLRTPTEK